MPTAETEEETEQVEDAEPARAQSVARSTFVFVSIAAAVFAVIAVALVVIIARDRPKNSDSAERTEIATTAAQLAEALTAIDVSGSSTQTETIQRLGTAPVLSQYNEIGDALRKLMVQLKLSSIRGTAKEVYVGNVGSGEAKVIVQLDLVYVGDNTRVIPDQYLDMSLAKLDGTWKVDNVQVLNVALAGASSSTTTPGGSVPPTSTASSSG